MPGKKKQRDPAFLYYDADVALDISHMNRLERGCYLDLIQLHRKYNGYTLEQLKKVLGIDFDTCWNALELTLEYDPELQRYYIPWLNNVLQEKAQKSKDQTDKIQKYWNDKKMAENGTPFDTTNGIQKRNKGSTKGIQMNNNSTSIVVPIIETVTETETKLDEDIGGQGEEGEGRDGVTEGNWKVMPGNEQRVLELPPIKVGCVQQFMHLNGTDASNEQIEQLWKIFKIQNFTGKKFYADPEDAYSHFINWSKTQKVNGNHPVSKPVGPKLGTSEARTETAKRW